MRIIFILFAFLPFLAFSQNINKVDVKGKKQGQWIKNYKNKKIRYSGQFKDDIPQGIFKYYYKSGELQATKEFFHNGVAAATHFYYKNSKLKASGLYVNEKKDSTWNYYNVAEILILSEEYKNGVLNGTTKTFYEDGKLYEGICAFSDIDGYTVYLKGSGVLLRFGFHNTYHLDYQHEKNKIDELFV